MPPSSPWSTWVTVVPTGCGTEPSRSGQRTIRSRLNSCAKELCARTKPSTIRNEGSILTRALGVGPSVDVDGAVHSGRSGDRLLLCSDGLWSEVADDELCASIDPGRDLDEVARAVVDQAMTAGGRDNISVVVADVVV
jgi:serine/threonine protein phosphatase PrpC